MLGPLTFLILAIFQIKDSYRNAFLAYAFALESDCKDTNKNRTGKNYFASSIKSSIFAVEKKSCYENIATNVQSNSTASVGDVQSL